MILDLANNRFRFEPFKTPHFGALFKYLIDCRSLVRDLWHPDQGFGLTERPRLLLGSRDVVKRYTIGVFCHSLLDYVSSKENAFQRLKETGIVTLSVGLIIGYLVGRRKKKRRLFS